jgi:hypothetical protein
MGFVEFVRWRRTYWVGQVEHGFVEVGRLALHSLFPHGGLRVVNPDA